MRAVLMTNAGDPSVLELSEIALPDIPSPSHMRVRLHAAGVNPIDSKIRKLNIYYPDKLPAVLGCDGAGIVEAVGASVTRFTPGDEVFFFNSGLGYDIGNYADYTIIHEDYAARKPRNLTMVEAAAVPLVLITAWEALGDRARLREGETVLIHGGAGGVGHVAIQIARARGAYVATTVSTGDKAEFAKTLGAELVIRYTEQDFVEEVLGWTMGMGVKAVFDTVGGEVFCRSLAATRVYGKVITLLSTPCELHHIDVARLRNLTLGYVQILAPMYLGLPPARQVQTRMLEEGAKMIEAGQLHVKVSHVLSLEEAAQAHRLIEEGGATGKIVLKIV